MWFCRAPLAVHTLATHLQACSWGMAWIWGHTGVGAEAPCPCTLLQQQRPQRQLQADTHNHHMVMAMAMAIFRLPTHSHFPAECLLMGAVLAGEAL